jgi:hypothetical protein
MRSFDALNRDIDRRHHGRHRLFQQQALGILTRPVWSSGSTSEEDPRVVAFTATTIRV